MQKPKFESEQEKVVRNINSFPTTFFRCYSQNLLADRLCQLAHANLTSQFSNLSFSFPLICLSTALPPPLPGIVSPLLSAFPFLY